jgi:site-specific DNA-methyltransferase (adenine-specific)
VSAPIGNRNAQKDSLKRQHCIRLSNTERQFLIGTYGSLTLGIQKLIAQHGAAKSSTESTPILDHRSVKPYFETDRVALYHGDAATVMRSMPAGTVDSIITSPPYYGQRDYKAVGQFGLEKHPSLFLDHLVATFAEAERILRSSGSLWVNLGDTYWSGKGAATGADIKQKSRRFKRPQDRSGVGSWCSRKQLLLIPHRFAIQMQDAGWIVRNDNVWHKQNPLPDPTDDRCERAHEYIFHFVKNRRYFFNKRAVALDPELSAKPLRSVWEIQPVKNRRIQHIAMFPSALTRIPILTTCPTGGTVLDPFCGSGTTLVSALSLGKAAKVVGIDVSLKALREARDQLSSLS